jgi:hypothetical protein
LIASETFVAFWEALKRLPAVLAAAERIFGINSGTESQNLSEDVWEKRSATRHTITAAVVVLVSCGMLRPYLAHTYGLLKETVAFSRAVEPKYQQALRTICQEHSEITLAELEAASKDWGFEWRPRLITETNRTPKCPAKPS